MKNQLDQFAESYLDSFSYALDNELILNWYPDRILNLVKGKNKSLLELGVGHGYSTMKFANRFDHYVVIEGSKEIITLFHEKFGKQNVSIIHSYFEDFTTTEKFDVIVMGFILEHVDDPELIMSKFKQFLKPGGSIIVTVPNYEALNKRIGYSAGLIQDLASLSDADKALGHQRLFNVQTLTELVTRTGYRIKTTEGLLLKPITTSQILQLNLSKEVLRGMLEVGVHYPELCVGILMEIEVR
ncbi:class I SAM-dependent methyltransferase [Cohnella boryungensis]|uniref:Class I SAM-dependent methyltransferase n=1 Tax=Cohnella boryungensis TaxID=768479 RepID=A0ABV8S9D1_9BACL